MTLFEAMKKYASNKAFRGHTPGHKGKLCDIDITEIDTEFPSDLIEKAQQKAAGYYSAAQARFLTGGSSMGIKAAVLATKKPLIVPADCHRSVLEAAELAQVDVIRLPQRISDGLYLPPDAGDYMKALNSRPDAAVLIQSPDYFGRTIDKTIIPELKKRGVCIIADSAHGAHFDFCGLSDHSFASAADFCVMSAHKTLPALTMGSVMTVNDLEKIKALDKALRLLGTTSPSYLILGSIEYALDYCSKHSAKYDLIISRLNQFRRYVACLDNTDPMRIAIDATALNTSGDRLYAYLKNKGFVAELATNRYVLFIFTIMDSTEDINNLKEVILNYER